MWLWHVFSYGGRVYVYKKPLGGWSSHTELTSFTVPNAYVYGFMADDPIAISEDQRTIAIADPYHIVPSVPDNYNGAVFVYHREADEEWNASIVPLMLHSPEEDVLDFDRGGLFPMGPGRYKPAFRMVKPQEKG